MGLTDIFFSCGWSKSLAHDRCRGPEWQRGRYVPFRSHLSPPRNLQRSTIPASPGEQADHVAERGARLGYLPRSHGSAHIPFPEARAAHARHATTGLARPPDEAQKIEGQ